MAHILTKRGAQDNIVTYEHMCDTHADLNNIPKNQMTLGSTAIVLRDEDDALGVYMSDSNKEWVPLLAVGGETTPAPSPVDLLHVLSSSDYDPDTHIPTVENPEMNVVYLVPSGEETGNNLFDEWIYTGDSWERFGGVPVNNTEVQADWNQNDPEAADYIKNRICYPDGEKILIDLPENTEPSFSLDGSSEYFTNLTYADFNTDDTYRILINDVEYYNGKLKNDTYTSGPYFSDIFYADDRDFEQMMNDHLTPRFSMSFDNQKHLLGGNLTLTDEELENIDPADNYHIVIKKENFHKIDAKYLPTIDLAISDWNQNDLAAADYVANRPNVRKGANSTGVVEGMLQNVASGEYSHAEGNLTTAAGPGTHSEGHYTAALGNYSHVEGESSQKSGQITLTGAAQATTYKYISLPSDFSQEDAKHCYINVENQYYLVTNINEQSKEITLNKTLSANAIDSQSFDMYYTGTIASASAAHAEGFSTAALEIYAHAEGRATTASGAAAHSEGLSTRAVGGSAHAEGQFTSALGDMSHAEGSGSSSTGLSSHVEGATTSALGMSAHAEGTMTVAQGAMSHAEGFNSLGLGDLTHVEGGNTSQNITLTLTGTANATTYTYLASDNSPINRSNYFLYYYKKDLNTSPILVTAVDTANLTISFESTLSTTSISNRKYILMSGSIARGNVTHAEGWTRADEQFAHAEGYQTHATIIAGHAEGYQSEAYNSLGMQGMPGAHAEGYQTRARWAAHSEGNSTQASGQASHAEGTGTKATENSAHAEGTSTQATGMSAHAEGTGTQATSQSAHAEGTSTQTTRQSAHAEGTYTKAAGLAAHAEGYGSLESISVNIGNYNNYTFTPGAFGSYSHVEGNQTYAGGDGSHAEGSQTVATSTGAHAEGKFTYANDICAHAEGNQTTASGTASHSEGYLTQATTSYAHSEGNSTLASGLGAHAEGQGSFTSISISRESDTPLRYETSIKPGACGDYSHAEGSMTYTRGIGSHAEGYMTKATGGYSHAEGNGTVAEGLQSHAEGSETYASGTRSHTEGLYTGARGENAHAEGKYTKADGDQAHAEGYKTQASQFCAHTEGGYTSAVSAYAHAENGTYASTIAYVTCSGKGDTLTFTITSEVNSLKPLASYQNAPNLFLRWDGTPYLIKSLSTDNHTMTIQATISSQVTDKQAIIEQHTAALAESSHAEGIQTTAAGKSSHAEGYQTIASNMASHSEGYYTEAQGAYSHAEGSYTTAVGKAQHVFGEFNTIDTVIDNQQTRSHYVEIVGNGEDNDSRSNARTLDWDGNETLAGSLTCANSITIGNTTITEAQLQALLALLN